MFCSSLSQYDPIPLFNLDTAKNHTYSIVVFQAEENNLLFMPIPNRRYEGKALYSLGKVTLYIDRGVVFAQAQGVWKPVSLQDLMVMAK